MRRLTEFVVLAFGFSWAVAAAYRLAGGEVTDSGFIVVAVVYMFGPLVAAVVVQLRRDEPLAEPLGARLVASGWLVVAWLVPAFLALLAVFFALAHPDASLVEDAAGIIDAYEETLDAEQAAEARESLEGVSLGALLAVVLVTGLVAGATVNAIAAFGEEAGWRGLMLYELRDKGFWRVSAVTGVVWGLWHAPLVAQGYNYPAHPAVGVAAMVAFTVLASPLLTYVRLKAQTVVAPSVFHGTVNATATISAIAVTGVSGMVVGAGVAAMAAFAVANVVMVTYDRWTGDNVTSSKVEERLTV